MTADGCMSATCVSVTPGANWTSRRCTVFANAEVAPCTRSCATGTYMLEGCTTFVDAVCTPCTPTPPGYITTIPCGERTDTVRGACPPSMACYGGVASAQCPTPRLVRGGRCVCPNATEAASDGDPCLPFACPQVLFSPLWLPLWLPL